MALPEVIATGGPATAGPTSDQFNDLIKIQSQALKTLVSIETSLVKSASQMAEAERAKLFAGAPAGAAGGAAAGGAGSGGGGGAFGKLLKGAGAAGLGAGLGIGAVLAGAGIAIGGVALLLNTLAEPGLGKNIKENVDQLLSINEGNAKTLQSLDLLAVFTSLGMGRAVFGAGSAVVGLSSAINKAFGVTDWAETVHDNVIELLSIGKDAGGKAELLAGAGAVAGALAFLGIGLAWFGAGSAIAGLSDALLNFANPAWAQSIKDNVLTLLSIADTKGKLDTLLSTGAVFMALSGLGAGLAIFGAGSTVAGLADGLTNFANKDWAASIKNNVLTLLSIADTKSKVEVLKDTGTVFLAFTGLAAGLAIFGAATTVVGLADALTNFANAEWATNIKNNVLTLLSIADTKSKVEVLKDTGTVFLALSGLGAGLAIFGAGSTVAGLSDGVLKFANPEWATTIKNNVLTLLSIADTKSKISLLADTGTVFIALSGLGAGLAIFGAGSTVAGLADGVTKFANPEWATNIKNNVLTLLSIADTKSALGVLSDTGTVFLAMSGLAASIAIFSAGSAVAGITDGMTNLGNAEWATNIKNNVLTLLSIADGPSKLEVLADTGTVFLALSGLAAGIAIFSAGTGVAGVVDGLTNFSNPEWANNLKKNVNTLLSIADADGEGKLETLSKTGTVFLAMSGLAAGMAIFALGTGAVAFVDKITGNKDYAQQIKDQVTTLLSIAGNPNATPEKVKQTTDAMAAISKSLGDFAGQTFFSSLKSAGAAVFNFFSGAESPTTALLQLADKADDLEKVGNALDKIGIGLSTFSSIGSIDVDLKDLSENLKEALPDLERAIMGGYVDTKGWGGIDIKGLASPDIKYQEAAQNLNAIMNSVSGALPTMMSGAGGGAVSPGGGASSQMIESMTIRTAIIQSAVIQGPIANAVGAAPAGGATATNVIVNAPATSTTTAVSNTSETIFSASDPYVPIARRFD